MKHAFKRKNQPGRNDGRTYRTYNSVADSARDLVDLYEWNNLDPNLNTAYSFAQELKNDRYYEDTVDNYSRGLNRFLA